MYVETIFCENMGPIAKAVIKAGFTPEGNPKPIVLVGKNGSGKSIMLSNVVDALHELGGQAFTDVTKKEGAGHKYFKMTSENHIRLGAKGLVGYVRFTGDAKGGLEYLYLRGDTQKDNARTSFIREGVPLPRLQLDGKTEKSVTKDKEKVREIFTSSVFAFFPSYRYAIPEWMVGDYAAQRIGDPYRREFNGNLNRPIVVDNARFDTPTWIEDVVIDSRSDLTFSEKEIFLDANVSDKKLLKIAKENVEKVLSSILEQEITLRLGYRSEHENRLAICKKGRARELISPSFDALSTGQAILADLFITILRYADSIDINKSIKVADIEGIVIVDEIDAHLHADLQYHILPKVLKLFPKVQFIVTAHAPLFVLGMEKEYGGDGFDVYEMPECNRISAENYREFQKAFDWLQESKTAQERQRKLTDEAINSVRLQLTASVNDEILVITEGCTDWKHMEHALCKLSADYPELWGKARFWHYHPKGKGNGEPEFDMGDSEVVKMCDQFRKLRQNQKLVFIVDADHPEKTKDLIQVGATYKNWGNNVYSFQIPNSELRPDFSAVCIEHYYTDDELKTEIEFEGVKRRLFLSGEFTKRTGQTKDHQYFYENIQRLKKSGQYDIIEGDQGNRVTKLVDDSDNPTNFAISKNVFASEMLAGNPALVNVSVEAFRKIFDVLKQIANEPLASS